jgi:release factor glutamine methyltransferase
MLVNEAIAFAEQELKRSNNLNSRLDSEILVSHLINIPRESIYSKLKENLPSNKTEELQKLVSRRVKKEPIAYILNNKEFWSTNFYVDRSVLIPRPETEVLIDLILSQISNKNNYLNILDIGTGSGCILISLLKELVKAKGIGVDKSSKAIAIAKKNSISQQVDNRASFKNVNLEEIKFDKKFDLIVSNPPYLPDVSLKNLNLDIKLYEPKIALQGGVQGVDFLCKIIT